MPNATVKIKAYKVGDFNFADKQRNLEIETLSGMRQLIEDIHRTSRPITPMLSGQLRGDVKKNVIKLGDVIRGTIEWARPYAWYQERGYTNGVVKRYTTPGTRAHFAEESVVKVTQSSKRYFGKKI